MAEYIEKEKIIAHSKDLYCRDCNSYNGVRCSACSVCDCMDDIEDFPAAEVAPVVHGRWVPTEYKPYLYKKCDKCGFCIEAIEVVKNKFCYNCGAKMDLECEE